MSPIEKEPIKRDTSFLVTGSLHFKLGLDLKYIPSISGAGVNLSGHEQTLAQSCLAAKVFFSHAHPKSIRFVLIGLTPSEPQEDLQCLVDYINLCREYEAYAVGVMLPVFRTKAGQTQDDSLESFRHSILQLEKMSGFVFIDLSGIKLSDRFFNDSQYLNPRGAAAVSVLLSVRLHAKKIITAQDICSMNGDYFGLMARVFPKSYDSLLTRLITGAPRKAFKALPGILPDGDFKRFSERFFFHSTYGEFKRLSNDLPKDDYNWLMEKVFATAALAIGRKKLIKVAFVIFNSSMWCGDGLYNLFARDQRFEPTVFLCRRVSKSRNTMSQEEFVHSVELFRAHGLNLVTIDSIEEKIPMQDILILLSPYVRALPRDFHAERLTPRTLIVNIPYSLSISKREKFMDNSIFHIVWKMFFASTIALKLHDNSCSVGMPRGVYSGYPRMDEFFDRSRVFSFSWKLTRPNARKIIYAPHWSIDAATKYATFQWNYRFMFDFAKAHPEISWVVKPHPGLFFSAVKEKLFSSIADMEQYFREWSELPNAQVYTGAYYQSIFATSDGMIHDSGSFIAEYQYVDKPMIFLTRAGEKFNELGEKILAASYCVDGQNLDAIAALILRVFVEGVDDKAAMRKVVFDAYLNYPKRIGMSSSEFIFKNIVNALKED